MNTRETAQCPECGVPLPEYWPKGFCPQCALKGALAIEDQEAPEAPCHGISQFGDFELLEEIGRGGMGVIYRAREISLNRIVALKMILAGQFASKEEVLRFRSEAEAAAHLQHPNIIRIHGTGERDGHHYFSMDYVEGRTLAEIVRDGPLPAKRAAKYACRIAEAIHYAHAQGVLHRDLKPSNVVIDTHDEPRIMDFGLAKRLRKDFGVTVTGQVLGSPNFMPPEQTSARSGKVGPASDVYGVGAILYSLLTGRPPFHAETVEELLLLLRDVDPVSPRLLNPSVPRDLETICLKCLEKDPARRYGSAAELANELGRFLRGEPIDARPLRTVAKIWRWCQRRPAIASLSLAVLLLLSAVAISSSIAAWRVNRARSAEQQANRDLRHNVSLLELERVEDFFTANDAAFALAHLSAMLRRDPSNAIAANRLISALSQRSWALPHNSPMQHIDRVAMAAFSPDGKSILTCGWENIARVWDVDSIQTLSTLGHGSRLSAAHYSFDGSRILTAAVDGTVRLWNAITGAELSSFGHSNGVYWTEFSRDGALVVTASADRTARVWDANTGALKRVLHGHGSHVIVARFIPDGTRIITGGSHGSVRVWDTASGETLFRVEDRNRPLTSLAVSPAGDLFAVACDDGIVKVWSAASAKLHGVPLVHRRPVWHVDFSPDGKQLLTACEDGAARLWNVESMGTPAEPLRHDSGVVFGRFSPDGRSVVTTSSDNTARVWEVATGKPLCQPLRHLARVHQASFSADGSHLVTASFDGTAQIWQLRKALEPSLQMRHGPKAAPFAISPTGGTLLSLAHNKTAQLWDLQTGHPLSEPIPQESFATVGEFSPNERFIVLADAEGVARVWECSAPNADAARRARIVSGPIRHRARIYTVRFNPEGSLFATASADGTARIWNITNAQPVAPALTHQGEVVVAQFSRDGRKVVTASKDGTARVWDTSSGKPLTVPLSHFDHVKWAEFSPKGDKVATASSDNSACVWDANTGRKLLTLQHARIVDRIVFSQDGRLIATACLDRSAQIWDANTGQLRTPPLRHLSGVADVRFSLDAKRLYTMSWSSLGRMWETDTGRPLTEWMQVEDPWGTCLDPAGARVIFGSVQGNLKVWQMPEVPMPVPGWFPEFTEALAGIRLGNRGNVEFVNRHELRRITEKIVSRNSDLFYKELALRLCTPVGTQVQVGESR